MMNGIYFLGVLFIAILSGCTSSNKGVEDDGIEAEYDLKYIKHCDVFMKQPQLQFADSALIAVSYGHNDVVCEFYSVGDNVRRIGTYGSIGNGPGEFLQPLLTFADGDVFGINDVNISSLFVLQIKKDRDTVFVEELQRLKAPYKTSKEGFVPKDIRFVKLGEQNFVSSLNMGNGCFFTLFDSSLQPISRFGDAPVKDDLSPYVMRSRLSGKTASNQESFFYATTDLPYLASYSLHDGDMVKDWEIFYKTPYYGISDGDIKYIKEKSTGPMKDMKVDDKYIYILYLDQLLSEYDYANTEKSCANKIFVFSHEGEKVACLNLNCRLSNMAIDSKKGKIYGIAEIPDVSLVEFTMPDELTE